ncbi:MAG: M28 family peptidase [bacterium]|nr:M28 family peptidase [bacterium]
MNKFRVLKSVFFFLCCTSLLVGISFSSIYSDVNLAKVAQEVDEQYIKTIVSDLSNLKSRVPGYQGNEEASEYIENIFQKIGLENVKRESFPVTVPVDKGASLVISNTKKELSLYCLWPNLIRTPTLSPSGIRSQIIDGKTGNFEDLNGKTIQDRIVLLDFNCGNRWLDISMLGAKAFIFIEPEDTTRVEAEKKYLNLPLNIPRYWISRQDGLYLRKLIEESDEKLDVHLKAKMDWERKITKNVLGWISGSDSELKKEVIVIEAYYDSISVVPSIAPGADSACSIAALIQIAKILRNNPPSRTILFLATSGHFLERRGIDAFLQAHCRLEEPFKSKITDPMDIKLFLCIDLSSHNDELVIYHDADENPGYFASFGKTFMSFATEIGKIFSKSRDNVLINGISPEKGLNIDSITVGEINTDAGIIGACGIPALCFITAHDSRRLVDTPLDRLETVDFKNLLTQVKHISCLFYMALNKKEFFPDVRAKFKDNLCTLKGSIVTFDPRKSFVPDQPVSGGLAVLKVLDRPVEVLKGVRPELIELTDENGSFEISRTEGGESRLEAYSLDSESGDIVYAPDMGVYGDEMYPIEFEIDWRLVEHTIVLFPCIATNVYELLDPRYLTQLDNIDVFEEGNSIPSSYGYSFIKVKPWDWTSSIETYGVVYSSPNTRIKLAFGAGPLGMRLLLLNSKDTENKIHSEGDGFLISKDGTIGNTSFQAAKDMLLLNQFRMENLEKYGISNDRLWHLHKKAEQALQKATKSKENKKWDEFVKHSRRAVGIESRAYPDVKATANDVIKGIIFYLALLIPFAYFMERLLFGFVDIKKQIGGVAGIFIAIYMIMRFVHPAFKLTNAPEIILLAFIIMMLSVIVLLIISSKFEERMQNLKRKMTRSYESDVSRASASAAAFSLGISNMKKRKIRTLLTSTTLILLTFTVLSFTSVKSFMKFNQVPRDNNPLYEGAMIRDRTWNPIEEPAYEYIKAEFKDVADVSPRAWYIPNKDFTKGKSYIKVNNGDKSAYVLGLIGLTPQEERITGISKYLKYGDWFNDRDKNVCIISDKLAELISISSKDVGKSYIQMFGNKLLVKGIFNASSMFDLKDLDDERLTPVDFMITDPESIKKFKQPKAERMSIGGGGTLESFNHLEYENVVMVPYKLVQELGGTIQSVAIKFNESVDVRENIENFISRLAVTLFAGIDGKVAIYSSLGLSSLSGMGNLFIPILIASLIVLNTMMGSVYERFKEIGIYSSVGLAPVHISALFIAESCVYAVLGAVSGYLLGQVVAKVLTVFDLLGGLTLNYSSTSAVASTLIVMATVILSTIYPARKAAELAVPDVTRKWEIPEPIGDNWEFDFPFTVSGTEILGLNVFLKNYFASYEEESVGDFYTNGANLYTSKEKEETGYALKTRTWLAPFDLGVSQDFQLKAIPAGEYNVYNIKLLIVRLSGETGAWKRLNRHFLDTLRKQFLVWRTISPEIKNEYKEEGEKLELKFEARSTKYETISNDKNTNAQNNV